MDIGRELDAVDRPVMVEAAYLCGRVLGHAMTKQTFLRQLESDVKSRYRDQSARFVLHLLSSMERDEGVSLPEMSTATRAAYASELNDALWERIDGDTDDAQVERALADLGVQG